jgi:hypothetical protein
VGFVKTRDLDDRLYVRCGMDELTIAEVHPYVGNRALPKKQQVSGLQTLSGHGCQIWLGVLNVRIP